MITELCTGCGLCKQICPQKCICIEPDLEGFLVPSINKTKCVNCKLCVKRCPQNNSIDTSNSSTYFSVINGNESDLKRSSSGGMFIILAKYYLDMGGVVCGCIYDDNMKVKHVITDQITDVYKMCGSKYVQSEVHECYQAIYDMLIDDVPVLFTGTACQVAALREFLRKEYTNLFTVDILCHGVPSPALFAKYVEYLNRKYNGRITDVSFRCKDRYGWGSEHRTRITIKGNNGNEKFKYPFMPAYFCAFFYGINLRESCYQCKYAGSKRISDITIGDYWGSYKKFGKKIPEGISIVSCNTTKGEILLKKIRGGTKLLMELESGEAKGSNTNFYHPTNRYNARDTYYHNFDKRGYIYCAIKTFICRDTFKRQAKSILGALKCRFLYIQSRLRLK